MKVKEDRLIRDYLDRLAVVASVLPEDRGRELIADVTEHLSVALDAPSVTTEADRRQVLDRLGQPEEIVRAALEDQPAPLPPVPASSSATRVTLIVVGGVVALVVFLVLLGLAFFMATSSGSAPVR